MILESDNIVPIVAILPKSRFPHFPYETHDPNIPYELSVGTHKETGGTYVYERGNWRKVHEDFVEPDLNK